MGATQMGSLRHNADLSQIDAGQGDSAEGKTGSVPKAGAGNMVYVIFTTEEESNKNLLKGPSQVSSDFNTEEGDTGVHTTDTLDYGFILEGELTLELDDGAETILKAGDFYVQNGTRHAWHNRSGAKAVVAAIMIGAER
jgi:mannose-6-phosphate isomerase-like protein (cupin superfamily)